MKAGIYAIIALIAAVGIGFGWHADQAKMAIEAALSGRDQVWADAFAQYNKSVDEAASDERKKIGDSDLVMAQKYQWLEAQFLEAEAKLKETNNALAASRRKAALSANCNACRIPDERLRWRATVTTGDNGAASGQRPRGATGAVSAPAAGQAVPPSK